jgi:parallel beta-helix repeat protein
MPIANRSLTVILILLLATTARAADYYVKNGGSDGNSGLSVATAWATLQRAADVVNPGDTVHVQPGNYQGFYLNRSGTAGSPITFIADGPGVAIDEDNDVTPDGINLEAASYVVIDGFTVDNRTRTGIRAVLAEFVTIRNCRAGFNGRWGILTGFVDDVLIENNEMHDSVDEHGIYVSNSGDRPVIRNNLVFDNHANGIHMNGDLSEGGDGVISGALVENNVIHGNGAGGGSGINMDGVTDSLVRNNLVFDHHSSGISLYRIDGGTGSKNNVVVNNTFITAGDGRWAVNISGGSTGNTILNNILYTFHSFRGAISIDAASRPGFVSDYNSLMDRFSTNGGNTVITLAAWQALGYDAHSFIAVPADHFVDPSSDFHLLAGSPAVDSGTTAQAPATDLDGTPRPLGAGVDIGAYELESASCGNGNVETGEECDAAAANGTESSCCTAGCQFKPNGSASCDGNVCTRPDTCTAGVCTPGGCADGNPCTICGGNCDDTGSACECLF